ncbi:MAG: ankyrin repeat domain-containing protein, partial [Bacteroidia bacterium]|nr:ankyrin repeat domain-containing protein [Bacteroidia bacterium]
NFVFFGVAALLDPEYEYDLDSGKWHGAILTWTAALAYALNPKRAIYGPRLLLNYTVAIVVAFLVGAVLGNFWAGTIGLLWGACAGLFVALYGILLFSLKNSMRKQFLLVGAICTFWAQTIRWVQIVRQAKAYPYRVGEYFYGDSYRIDFDEWKFGEWNLCPFSGNFYADITLGIMLATFTTFLCLLIEYLRKSKYDFELQEWQTAIIFKGTLACIGAIFWAFNYAYGKKFAWLQYNLLHTGFVRYSDKPNNDSQGLYQRLLLKAVENPYTDSQKVLGTLYFKELLKKAKHVNHANADGLTALHIACAKKDLELIRPLISHGANPNSTSIYGITPAHALFCSKDASGRLREYYRIVSEEFESYLIHIKRLSVHAKSFMSLKQTADGDILRYFDVSRKDFLGNAPLHFASLNDTDQLVFNHPVKKLIELDPNLNRTNRYGDTPLHFSVFSLSGNATRILIENRAKILVHNQNGKSVCEIYRSTMHDYRRRNGVYEEIFDPRIQNFNQSIYLNSRLRKLEIGQKLHGGLLPYIGSYDVALKLERWYLGHELFDKIYGYFSHPPTKKLYPPDFLYNPCSCVKTGDVNFPSATRDWGYDAHRY